MLVIKTVIAIIIVKTSKNAFVDTNFAELSNTSLFRLQLTLGKMRPKAVIFLVICKMLQSRRQNAPLCIMQRQQNESNAPPRIQKCTSKDPAIPPSCVSYFVHVLSHHPTIQRCTSANKFKIFSSLPILQFLVHHGVRHQYSRSVPSHPSMDHVCINA